MHRFNVGIAGSGAIALAYAATIALRGHTVTLWSPRTPAQTLRTEPLRATGIVEQAVRVTAVDTALALAPQAEVIIIAVPLNGHRTVIDALLPHLRSGQQVIVSSMGSLSSLYVYEKALAQGLQIAVVSFGTTALTARRKGPAHVNIMTRRPSVGVSCLPRSSLQAAISTCEALFDSHFSADDNPLISALGNTNAVSHVPLALFNWTRIERAEAWPQYHCLTPRVAAVIEALDAERQAVARAFGWALPGVSQKLCKTHGLEAQNLARAAAQVHAKRGGPPGPVDVETRYVSEDVPFGLVFTQALAAVVRVPTPVTDTLIAMAELITGQPLASANDLIEGLDLRDETAAGLLARVNVG